jgi:hypothetical protein
MTVIGMTVMKQAGLGMETSVSLVLIGPLPNRLDTIHAGLPITIKIYQSSHHDRNNRYALPMCITLFFYVCMGEFLVLWDFFP